MRKSAAIGFLLLAWSLSGCDLDLDSSAPFKEERHLEVSHQLDTPLEVQAVNGGVTIVRGSGETVSITATIRAKTEERLASVEVKTDRKKDGTLVVSAAWPEGGRLDAEGCGYELTIPDVKQVLVRTQNGAITLEDLAGRAELETSNGSIRVENHEGPVRARTSNGKITLRGISSEISARTSNGAIEIDRAGSSVEADTSNGRITARLSPQATGPVQLSTSNGAVEFEFGEAFCGQLELSTTNGKVRFTPPEGEAAQAVQILSREETSMRLVAGEGDAEASSVTTTNGSVEVRFVPED